MKPKDRDMELFADELRDAFTNVYEPGNDDNAWLAVGEYVAQLLRTTNDCENRQRHIDALAGQAALEERDEQIRQLQTGRDQAIEMRNETMDALVASQRSYQKEIERLKKLSVKCSVCGMTAFEHSMGGAP